MIPAGITTATVHLDAPVSFTGEPGRLYVVIEPSVSLIWTATGTPLGKFVDTYNLNPGTDLVVELPHTDQPGFEDGFGNSFTGWYYTATVVYEKDGYREDFPPRDFQILTGQTSVDLALVPAGEAAPVPAIAPILPVTSIDGFTGAVTKTILGLDRVNNTTDAEKPVSAAAQAALDLKLSKAEANATFVSAAVHGVKASNTAADNTAALAAAMTSAAAAGAGVILPAGTLALNNVTATVPIRGAGIGRTVINGARITIGGNGITLSDFSFVSSDLYAITASQKSDVTLRNLSVAHSGALELALQSDRVTRLTITGCQFAVGGVEVITTNDFLITGNYWDAQYLNVNEPLHITAQSSGVVSDNTFKNTMTDAIDLYSSGEYCVITGNRLYGLKGASGIECKVTMSDIPGNTSGPGNVFEAVVISNNILRDFSRNTPGGGLSGIYAEFVDSRAVPTYAVPESNRGIIITGNVLEDFNVADPGFAAHYNGIMFTGHNGIISNNVIRNSRSWNGTIPNGIGLAWTGAGQKVVGVRVSGNVIAGIENGHGINAGNMDQCQISDNIIRQDDVTGIQTKHGISIISGVTLNHCTIEGNTFACNTSTSYGIRSSYSTSILNRCNIQGNILKDCAIFITVAQYCSFMGNTIENGVNSQASGVGLAGTSCRGNSYIGNHITMSADYALSLIDHDGFVISSNTFSNTNRAVLLNGVTRNGILDNNISITQTNPEFPHYSGVSVADQNTMGVGMNNVNGLWKQAPFLISANGTRYQLTVGDDGALTTTAL